MLYKLSLEQKFLNLIKQCYFFRVQKSFLIEGNVTAGEMCNKSSPKKALDNHAQ